MFRKYGLSKDSITCLYFIYVIIIVFAIIDINIGIMIIALLNCQIYISLVDLD